MAFWGKADWRPGTRRITNRKPLNSEKKKNTSDVDPTDPETTAKLSPVRFVARRLYITSFIVVNFFLSAALITGSIFVLINSDSYLWLLVFLFGSCAQMLLAWLAVVKNQRMQKYNTFIILAVLYTAALIVMIMLELFISGIVVFIFSLLILVCILVYSWVAVIRNLQLRIKYMEI